MTALFGIEFYRRGVFIGLQLGLDSEGRAFMAWRWLVNTPVTCMDLGFYLSSLVIGMHTLHRWKGI